MLASDEEAFVSLLTGVSDYYGKELSQTTISLYWEGLKAYDYPAIERAMWQHTQSPDEQGRWMPKIADLKAMMVGRTADQASLAWSKVNLAVRQVGTLYDVIFDDALIHRCLADMGGWCSLTMKEEKEWPFIAKEFENRYRGYKMTGQQPDYPRILTGTANAENETSGMPKMPARLLGDETLCRQVAKGGQAALGQPTKPKRIGGK